MAGRIKPKATKKRPPTKFGHPRARKGVKLRPTELGVPDLRLAEPAEPPSKIAELTRSVEADGGVVLATYREPASWVRLFHHRNAAVST